MKKAFEYAQSIKEQICDCGKHYNAKWLLIVDELRDTTSGMCRECFIAWRQKVDQEIEQSERIKQEALAQALIATRRRTYRENTSGIPLYYQSKDFSNISTHVKGNMNKVCPECMKYADNYPLEYKAYLKQNGKAYSSLFLTSPGVWGNGKTHLACAILHRVLDRWQGKPNYCPVLFITEPEIYMKIQNTYSFNGLERQIRQSETDIINELINIPLLVIDDDIGKQKRSDMKFVQRTLFMILNGRYDAMNPTIMTANMSMGHLKNYLAANDNVVDKASYDRLMETCKGNFWLLEGESQRGKI